MVNPSRDLCNRARAIHKRGPRDQRGRLIGRTKGGMNTKLHAVADAAGRPIRFFMTAGQISDYTGTAAQRAICSLISLSAISPKPTSASSSGKY